jgi:hypothetical protein
MAIMTTGAHPKDLWPGVKAHFGATYEEHPEEFAMIFDMEGSDKSYEERVQYVGLGLAPTKDQGASIDFDQAKQGYVSRITNITYGIGGIVTREAIEDGQYESIANRLARYIAFSIRQTCENVGANIINRATTAGYTGGDGVVLASASHPETNGNQSNLLSPAADLSEQSLEDLLIQITNATDSQGLKISLTGQKLIIPTALQFEATRILNSVLQSNTANNDINALRDMGMLPGGIVINHYLTDTDAWGIKTNAPEGLICQMRRGVEFDKDNEFQTENALMKGTIRKGFGWAEWRGYYHSSGA